jgi:hypothetical protein
MQIAIPSGLSRFTGWLRADGRHFQILSQIVFLFYGVTMLGWDSGGWSYLAAFAGAMGVQFLAVKYLGLPLHSLKSSMITVLGLCLLLKANHPVLFFAAGALAIGQKFLVRINGRHIWNTANLGIIIMILLTGEANGSGDPCTRARIIVWCESPGDGSFFRFSLFGSRVCTNDSVPGLGYGSIPAQIFKRRILALFSFYDN